MKELLVYHELKQSAERWPDLPAIHDEYGTLSFAGLFAEAEACKRTLLMLGVCPGQGIGVMARNSRQFIIAVFGVLGCGAAAMPVSHQLKRPELDEILEKARLHAILDDFSGMHPIPEQEGTIFPVSEGKLRFFRTSVPATEQFAAHVQAPAFVRFTSGTTGTSKGVVIDNQAVIERTSAANASLNLNTESKVVWVLPMAYHFVVSIVLYIRVGAAIIIVKDFLAPTVIGMCRKFGGTLLYASPMQIRFLASDRGGEMLPTLKKVISTSSGLHPDISKAFRTRFGISVHQAFGIIEVGLPIINTEEGEEETDAVGFVLPDYEVRVFDEQYNPLPAGEVGLLGIRGPGMFAAYLSPPVLREEILVNGYFFPADYASVSEKGLVRIEGRKKSMINVSGNKVFAEEVEQVLEQLPYIRTARVSGVPHPLMGQIIQAEVVLEGCDSIDVEATLTYCRDRLSTFKIPQKVVIVDALEMTGSGKVRR